MQQTAASSSWVMPTILRFRRFSPSSSGCGRGPDLVMGNRFKGGIAPSAMPFLHATSAIQCLVRLGQLFFDVKVGDFHCGLRGFNRDRVLELNLRTTGMEFASEMVVRRRSRLAESPRCRPRSRPDGRVATAALTHLAGRLATPQFLVDVQSTMAVPLSGNIAPNWRRCRRTLAVARAGHDRRCRI